LRHVNERRNGSVPLGQFAAKDGSFGSRMWLVHERRVCLLESGLLIQDQTEYGSPEARLEGGGSLGSRLHRERKWIQLVRGRKYRRDTGWARLGAEGSSLIKVYAR
jgi:hypothetical protein